MSDPHIVRHRIFYMLGLILAGEAIYALPFHVTRFFRPTVLEVFDLTNTELGTAQAVYGVIAMLSYFPGGPLADRFPARKLLAWSLWSTAAGGLYMATMPGFRGALIIWGFFGFTTILLFWAALIRATREWGGIKEQGRAFGFLEGGRGA
ncbi:MAG: MFS transporter, partial [Xanthomonadales bacterium]|nr:MFS transporter [Xanthomonadales bacterium]